MSNEVNVSESGEKIFNTRRLQIFELNNFMLNNYSAVFDGVGYTGTEFMQQWSFAQAVKLFNERDLDEGGHMIQRVKLRYCKKSKAIICTNHLVRLTQGWEELAEEEGAEPFAILYEVLKGFRLR